MAFLSLMDDRAKPKGSRDPLGFELVWSYFGRQVIGNLTTITSSMDNFAVAILGFYWVNNLEPPNVQADDQHERVREHFLRYEQLAGYLRCYGNGTDIMGITRIRRRIADDSREITLGMSAEQQILSDQASYGLWGLYSVAASDTGFVTGQNRTVTKFGEPIARKILDQLGSAENEIKDLWLNDAPFSRESLQQLSGPFMRAIQHNDVQEPLLKALLSGNSNQPVQRELWNITRNIFSRNSQKPRNKAEFIEFVLAQGPSECLAARLRDIVAMERVLVAANNVFHYCRRKNGEKLDSILVALAGRNYNYSHLPDTLPTGNFPRRSQIECILQAFKTENKKAETVIEEIIRLNRNVMQQRNGAPWLEIDSGGLRVKVESEKAELRSQENLETHWDHDYFLGSYLNIARNYFTESR